MNKQIITILLLLLTLVGCIQQRKKGEPARAIFKIPVVIQELTKDTIEFSKVDFLNNVWFRFYGKYKFTDTLKFDKHCILDPTYRKDVIWEYSRPRENDTLTTDGFQIFTDYKTTIYIIEEYLMRGNYYFPVYVVNETSRTKIFIGKDNYVFGIQEAIDTSKWSLGEWRPIESRGFDFCGNGYFGLKIHPGEFVMFLVPRYEGDEKQLMRIRLKIGESLYLSQSYVGTFNHKQFYTKKGTWVYNELKENKKAIQRMFYGATPKGYDDEE